MRILFISSLCLLALFLALGILFLDLIPQTTQAASVSTVKSGNWSDPAVWSTGTVPTTGDAVTIASGHTVTYDVQSNAVLSGVTINGTLYFSRTTDTRLKTSENLMVHSGGYLDTGTAADFIPKNITAEIIFVLPQGKTYAGNTRDGQILDMANDTGLWVMSGGRWEVHGAPLLRTWSKLAANATAGSTKLIVQNDVTDWHVGGDVVVTQTSNPAHYFVRGDGMELASYRWENELRTIAGIRGLSNGTTEITINRGLNFAHSGTSPLQGEVGLLTRNVRITTEIVGANMDQLLQDPRNRKFAHTMRMHGSSGDIQYGEFKFLGHYDTLGRYPIHLHQLQNGSRGMKIRGNSIWNTGFRWAVVHDSYGVTVEDNVGYNSIGIGFFTEPSFIRDPNHPNSDQFIDLDNPRDTAYIHNLGVEPRSKSFADRTGNGPAEYWDISSFWPSQSDGEAFFGNVAVGSQTQGGHGSAAGYWHAAIAFGGPAGTSIPGEFFLANEAHSNEDGGHAAWQNRHDARAVDFIDSLLWRNGKTGYSLGAYVGTLYVHNAKLFENGNAGVASTIIDAFVQDSEITGSTADNSRDDFGWQIQSYFAEQSPREPHWNVRNTYRNLPVGFTHRHDVCTNPGREAIVETTECAADYSYVLNNTFVNVAKPYDFGWQANANTFWKVVDQALGTFFLFRKDQQAPTAPISQKLVTPQTTLSSQYDALLTPASALPPGGVAYTGLLDLRGDPYDHTLPVSTDLPPQIDLQVAMSGKTATLTAHVTDDNSAPRVEFYADWVKIGEDTSAPYTATVDLSNHPRKYAYLWARAYDGVQQLGSSGYEQRAYSDVREIGPEVLLAGQSLPSPSPTPAPPVPQPAPLPSPTPTPQPTASPTLSPSLSARVLFLDRLQKLSLVGTNFSPSHAFEARLKKGNTTSVTLSNINPKDTTTLELDLSSHNLSSFALGTYTIELVISPDNHILTHDILLTKLGDLPDNQGTRDGKIDVADISRLLSHWGKTDPASLQVADVNGRGSGQPDGKIDLFDANKLMANWTG